MIVACGARLASIWAVGLYRGEVALRDESEDSLRETASTQLL